MNPLIDNYFNIIKKLIPAKPIAPAVGLDIGVTDCKIVALEQKEKGYELIHWAIEPIKNGDVGGSIKEMLKTLDVQPKSVYSSVAGKGTLIRYIDMPVMSLEDLRNSFSLESDKYFPFPQDQIYTDCYILDSQPKGSHMAVMAAAAKKDIIDQRVKLLSDIGLQVNFIGMNPIALANAVHVLGVSKDNSSGAIALLDMGEVVSNLTIIVDGTPRFTRDIFIGGRDFTKRISNSLGIGLPEAERLKSQPGDRLAEVLNACDTTLMNMVQEIRLSFDYFVTEKNREISKLMLTGGSSMLSDIVPSFEKKIEMKVERWNPLDSLTIHPKIPVEELKSKAQKLGVAIGLALYHYD